MQFGRCEINPFCCYKLCFTVSLRLLRWVGKLLEGMHGKRDGGLVLEQGRQYIGVSVMRQIARQLARGLSLADLCIHVRSCCMSN